MTRSEPCHVVVVTRNADGTLYRQSVIDHSNTSDRKWLSTHTFWAMRNTKMVTLCSIQERELPHFPRIETATPDSLAELFDRRAQTLSTFDPV